MVNEVKSKTEEQQRSQSKVKTKPCILFKNVQEHIRMVLHGFGFLINYALGGKTGNHCGQLNENIYLLCSSDQKSVKIYKVRKYDI